MIFEQFFITLKRNEYKYFLLESFELEFLIKSENIPNIQGSKASLALSNLSILDE